MSIPQTIREEAEGLHTEQELAKLYELLCQTHPKRIVEFGTWLGLVTTVFGSWASDFNATVLSLDVRLFVPLRTLLVLTKYPVVLLQENEYKADSLALKRIAEYLDSEDKHFVYCDGGNKKRELWLYSRFLRSGDIIACHDYNRTKEDDTGLCFNPETERVYLEDVKKIQERVNLVPLWGDDEISSEMHVMAFMKG